jgi:hypothetical protein
MNSATENKPLSSDDLKSALQFAMALGWRPAREIPDAQFDSEEPTLIIRRTRKL